MEIFHRASSDQSQARRQVFGLILLGTGLLVGLGAPVMAENPREEPPASAADIVADPLPDPQFEATSGISSESQASGAATTDFTLLPVGLGVDGRITVTSTLVRGLEDGAQAIDFEAWLVPFDAAMQALNTQVAPLENGLWELRSPGLLTQIDSQELQSDPELGLAISIADLQQLLGVAAEFDLMNYAIFFAPPWSSYQGHSGSQPQVESPVLTEGLPLMAPAPFTMTFAGQRLNVSGGSDRSTTTRGDFTVLGTLMGGSWFLRFNQASLGDLSSWSLSEAQYLLETPTADYALGSQPTFWQSQGSGNYWGVTTIQRSHYEPLITLGAGGFSPNARLQADAVGRDVVGEAAPGSVVQLVQGSRANIIAEAFVDSSGVYRFVDVPQGGVYEVLVYPNGQLTAQPEVQDISFSTIPSQLPVGASALVASAGLRQSANNSLFGNFEDFTGGLAYRQGVSSDLTLGAGVIYDQGFLGLGELFYQPADLPIQLAISALGGGEDGLNLDADFVYAPPASNFRLDLNTDRLSSRFRANWQVSPQLGLRATGNTRDGAFGLGLTGSFSTPDMYALASLDYLTNGDFRWNGLARFDRFELNSQGNEVGSNSRLLIKLDEGQSFTTGHFLNLGYETQHTDRANSLLRVGYRYQSPAQAADGRYLWAIDAGYGLGSEGSGPILALSTAMIPGLVVRARYEAVSAVSGEASFSLELLPFYNLQTGLATDDSRYEYFRRQGGLWIQPFMDTNANGIYDPQERVFVDNAELLLVLNHKNIAQFQPEIRPDGILVRTFPGMYRLDLDAAGYPLDWRPTQISYGVEVAAGGFTPVFMPFTVSYTIGGRVTDGDHQPVGGATVEAVPTDGGMPITTVTNGTGVYFLDNLQQGTYTLLINHHPAHPDAMTIDSHSDTLQEVNLRVPGPVHPTSAVPEAIAAPPSSLSGPFTVESELLMNRP